MTRSAAALARLLPARDPTPPDAQLLRAFAATRAEEAFAEVVRRHGPMVLATCRRVLGNAADADDAFQAVFLVLARKADAVRGANLAGWLYAVAVRTARGVRVMRDRRRKHELLANRDHPGAGVGTADPDLAAVIDEELALLPDHYREAVVLCELRGLSRRAAAAELGVPEGTLSSRLAAARRKLADRLSARGLAVPAALAGVLAPAGVSAGLVASAVSAARGAAGPVASAAATAVVKAMLFDQLKVVALAAGILLTAVCGGWAMTGTPGSDPVPAPAPRPADPARELVARLGAPEFADREAAEKALVALGVKAKPALRAGLQSESAEVRDRAAKALAAVRRDQIWDVFAKIAGADKAARDLFAKVMSSARGVAALEAVLDDSTKADDAYRTRTAELMRIAGGHPPVDENGNATVPTKPDVWAAPPPPLGDIAGWMLLGALQSGGVAWRDSTHTDWQHRLGSHVPFLPEDDYTSAKPIAAAYTAADAAPLKKLTAAWLAKRRENDMLRAGLALAIRYDIADALPGARGVLKTPKPAEVSPWNLAAAAVFVGVYGSKDDLPLLARHAADDRSYGTFLDLPPGTDLQFTPPPKEGRDLFCHVRDAVAATMCKLADKNPANFGFPPFPATKHPNGAPTSLSSATRTGFTSKADRDAAFDKAKAWLKSFEPAEPKKDEPKPDPAVLKLVGQLGAPDFADREAAAKRLRKLELAAEPALKAGLTSDDPEVRERSAKLLAANRSAARDALARNFDAAAAGEPDHPVWKRFKAVAGSDAAARALFAELVADPRRLKILDDAEREPEKAGDLYAAEVERFYAALEELWRRRVENPKLPERPWPDSLVVLYLGTYPPSAGKTGGKDNREFHLFRTWPEALRTPAGPAVARVFVAWLALRDDPATIGGALLMVGRSRVKEALPLLRKFADDDKLAPANRARAAVVLGVLGTRDDLPLLRRVAESKAANEPFEQFEVILKGREELEALSRSQFEFRARPVTPEEWEAARKRADIRQCDRTLADCAWAAAVSLAGGRPQDMGFLWPHTAYNKPVTDDWLTETSIHGFESAASRAAAHAKAKRFLDKQPTPEKKDGPKPDPAAPKPAG